MQPSLDVTLLQGALVPQPPGTVRCCFTAGSSGGVRAAAAAGGSATAFAVASGCCPWHAAHRRLDIFCGGLVQRPVPPEASLPPALPVQPQAAPGGPAIALVVPCSEGEVRGSLQLLRKWLL